MAKKYVRGCKIKRSLGDTIFDYVNVVLMFIVMFAMLAPMIHVVSVSFSSGEEVMKGGLFLWPRGFNTLAYQKVFQDDLIWKSYLNTILYTAAHTVLTIVITGLTAYPLSVAEFPLKKFVTVFITITMFIGGGTIPTYLLMKELHLINNRLVMIIPGALSAYNVILFRTFFQGIDKSMRESAVLDGAGQVRILFQIYVPLSKAIISSVALFTIVGKWNDWYSALIYLNEEKKYPVQMILRKILFNSRAFEGMDPSVMAMLRNNEITPANIQMATIVVVIFPIICIYPFIQKHFAKGVMIGGIKG